MVIVWILAGILMLILAIVLLLLLLMALPLGYSLSASWINGQGSLDWQLTYAWFIRLDRFIIKQLEKQKQTSSGSTAKKKKKRPLKAEATKEGVSENPETRKHKELTPPRPQEDHEKGTLEQAAPEPPEIISATTETPSDTSTMSPDGELKGEQGSSSSSKDMPLLMWQKRQWIWRWFTRFWGTLHLSPLCIYARVGLGDPYDTSDLVRRLVVCNAILPRGLQIEVEPEYLDHAFDGKVSLSGWLSLLHILVLGLLCYLDPQTKQLLALYKS